NALHTLIRQRHLTPLCGGHAPTAERTMNPARMFTESLIPRPELENDQDPDRKSACCRQRLNGYDRSNTLTVEWPRPNGSPPTLAGPFRSYNYQQISLARLQTAQAESGDSSIAWV